MLQARAYLLLAGLAVGAALGTACDRSATAPRLASARADVRSGSEEQLVGMGAGSATAIVPVFGGRIDLAARPDHPVDCTLEVPAGALDGPTLFELTNQSTGPELEIQVSARTTEPELGPGAFGDDPILLTLVSRASEGELPVTVRFSPPDGSEPLVVRASLGSGRATVLAYRRGRSKYSVIIF